MMYSEFTKLAGFQVKENYYHAVIEPEYNRSSLDKDAWVKEWKKQGGIQNAYDAMLSYLEDEKGKSERLQEMNENQRIALSDKMEEAYKLSCENDELKEKLHDTKILNDAHAYFLLEISEKYSCAELREKVIEMIGFKNYIDYKFKHDKCIWQLDRDEIMKHL